MSKFNRRQLLKSSIAAGALLVTGCGGPRRSSTCQPKKASLAPRRGPNEQIRLACIGFHGQGRGHIRGYSALDDVTIAMLCDTDTAVWANGQAILAELNKPAAVCVQDLRQVFDNKDIDAVSIATPNHWHALAAIWAMQAGKDVYVEKPVSHNISEGRRMIEAARKYNRICQTGTQCRSMQGTIDAIKYIREGKIGKVLVARGLCYKRRDSIGLCGGDQKVPDTLDYNIWSGPAPLKPPHRSTSRGTIHYDWHWFWDYGNGDLGNQGIHQMDIARWGLGKDHLPASVISFGGRFGYKDDGETPNTEIAFFDYGDSQLIFETRGLPTKDYKGAGVGVVFHGTEGYMSLNKYTGGAAFDKDGKETATFKKGGNHFRDFLDACRSGKHTDLNADIAEGHLSSALCHLANISYRLGEDAPFSSQSKAFGDNKEAYETFERTKEHLKDNKLAIEGMNYRLGRKLEIDAKTETFTNYPQANAMLTRPYRAPFVVPKEV